MSDTYVSEPMATVPESYKSPAQQTIFETLTQLDIPFLRVDTGDGTTMEACIPIGEKLQNPVIKTVFVTNRQQTLFWLYVMAPDKPFVTKEFCGALGIPRVSFASEERLVEMMGTPHGATTVLALVNDPDHRIQLVMDQDIAEGQYLSCTDGTNTGFLRIGVGDLLQRYLGYTGHEAIFLK